MRLRAKIYKWFGVTLFLSLVLIFLIRMPMSLPTAIGILTEALLIAVPVILFLEYSVFLRILRISKHTDQGDGGNLKIRDYGHDEITDIISYLNQRSVELKKVQEENTLLKEQLTSMLEDAPILAQRFDKDGKITFINNSYARHFELKEKTDLIGKNIFEFLSEKGYDLDLKADLQKLTLREPIGSYTYSRRSNNGWILWVTKAIFDEFGSIKEYQMIGIDITTQHEIEQRLEALADNISTIVISIGSGGNIEYVSRGLGLICLGCNERSTLPDLISEFFKQHDPTITEEIYAAIERRTRTSRRVRFFNMIEERFKWYEVDIKPIEDGKTLITIDDVHELMVSRSIIERNAEVRNFTYDIISKLTSVDLSSVRPVIDAIMYDVGHFEDADKVSLQLFDDEEVRVASQWSSPILGKDIQSVPIKTPSWWKEAFQNDPSKYIIIKDIDLFEDEEIRAIANGLGIKSSVIAPVAYNHTIIGAIIASSASRHKDWGELEGSTLRMVGRLIGTVIRTAVSKGDLGACKTDKTVI